MKSTARHRDPWHHGLSYPFYGIVLGLGATAGLLLVRFAVSGITPTPAWLMSELEEHREIYSYLLISTCVVLALIGILLGRYEDRLEHRSATDPLTGLANRGRFEDRLFEEFGRSTRYGSPFALLLIDLDRLKAINDLAGHLQGDRALRTVGECIADACRSSDFAARLGGDEFAILAPSTTSRQALDLARRLRAAIREQTADLPVPLSVSVGIADSTNATAGEALVGRADEALYCAKAWGRDGVAVADPREDTVEIDGGARVR